MFSRSRILLVGRDPHVTILRKQILEKEGYWVTVTDNLLDDSLLHLESVAFDGVILDYSIPSQQRRMLAAKIRKHHPEISILTIFQHPGEYDRTPTKFIYSLDGPEAMLQALREMLPVPGAGRQAEEEQNKSGSRSIH